MLGTMANLISVGVHCQRGEEVILGDKAHIFKYEGQGASAYMGVGLHTIPNQPDGTLSLADLANAVRNDDPHFPRTRLVAIENTHNMCGGRVLPRKFIDEVGAFCRAHKLKLHVDGARLANASVAMGVPMADLVRDADSVSLCLSKGLGAPIGSVVAGSKEFIYHAKRVRKSLGGGMRQVGIIASAGLYALEHQFDRLAEDHKNAKTLADGLAQIPGVVVDASTVDTNIVFFQLASQAKLTAPELVKQLAEAKGVQLVGKCRIDVRCLEKRPLDTELQRLETAIPGNDQRMRAVTHLEVSADDIEYTLKSSPCLEVLNCLQWLFDALLDLCSCCLVGHEVETLGILPPSICFILALADTCVEESLLLVAMIMALSYSFAGSHSHHGASLRHKRLFKMTLQFATRVGDLVLLDERASVHLGQFALVPQFLQLDVDVELDACDHSGVLALQDASIDHQRFHRTLAFLAHIAHFEFFGHLLSFLALVQVLWCLCSLHLLGEHVMTAKATTSATSVATR
ncbi:TPA: LOW QUALITY PROTEIN: hypothetical protein N0F65_004483 [Lagenidium giganteum]|uniref:Aromatic amino acid beta-eliminating lyase/threonine aldolase domain-containing protein n=1 Tax=Lagenidium giganteum TaxID=4803 RepID=A0AAV2ZFJ7_9STRA|nr:TPA: LOW QUALITY PROTEIN: hypothetical protein N0F65_004483 [Lagenidium giganteum]